MNVCPRYFFVSIPTSIKSSGIESIDIELSKKSNKKIEILLSSENEAFKVGKIGFCMDFLSFSYGVPIEFL